MDNSAQAQLIISANNSNTSIVPSKHTVEELEQTKNVGGDNESGGESRSRSIS